MSDTSDKGSLRAERSLRGLLIAALALFALVSPGCGDLVDLPSRPDIRDQPSEPSFPDEPSPDDPDDPDNPDDPDGPDFDPDLITITAVDPEEGPTAGGIDVMLSGTGFREGMEVFFGDAPAPEVFVINPVTAIVRLPPRGAGRVDLSATHPDAKVQGYLALAFRYFETIVVTAIEPARGPLDGGTAVTVRGRGFTADTRFFIGGRPALDQRQVDGETLVGRSPAGHFGAADVHAVGINGTATLPDAFRFEGPPTLDRLSPIVGPAAGGTEVALEGQGLSPELTVLFGGTPGVVVSTARDGTRALVLSPAIELASGFAVVDVSAITPAGASTLPDAFGYRSDRSPPDPLTLACSHLAPGHGPEGGGDEVELACTGLVYGDVAVTFGGAPAEIVALDTPGSRLTVTTPPGRGEVAVKVKSAASDWVDAGTYRYDEPAALAVDAIEPASGPVAGGTVVRVSGRGFGPGTTVQIGVLAATGVTVEDGEHLVATTPPGVPGLADVIVRGSGRQARLADAFDFTSDALALDLVAPAEAARSGGTWLRVYGAGFGDAATVAIGGVPCPLIARVSSAELDVRSPKLAVGIYDAVVSDGERSVTLPNAFVAYDPRSGTGGTRGGPIDETLNVTVWGSNGYGPVAGAFVLVGSDPDGPWRGVTDENGQVTISGPGLYGPVDVTASREGFTAYSVVEFDATNVTVLLTQNPVPPTPGGGGDPVTPLPNATLSGTVYGLDKYVIAPPASCEARAIPETLHCAACDPAAADGGCRAVGSAGEAPGFACLDVGDQGPHCVADCSADGTCPAGYGCQSTALGSHCLPSPGVKQAYCNISSPSLFGYEYPVPTSGWVDGNGAWTLDSRRLGELAIYCFGGYMDDLGVFTPTVMGLVRHFFAPPGGNITGIRVELDLPLKRSFRLRLQDPPTWPGPDGLADPAVAISLDLGPDGVIPFSRALVPVGDQTFVAPHQLEALDGPLYNAHYFLYTTLAPAGVAGYQPRSYNLVQNVQSIVEDRLPVRDAAGWHLDGAHIERDLRGIWAARDDAGAGSARAWAVGEAGTILLWNGVGWSAQASFTDKTLAAVSGVDVGPDAADVWAAGDDGAVRHYDGLAWRPIDAPEDDYVALLATPDAVYAAGAIRLRRYDRAAGTWSLEGAPAVQGVRGLVALGDGSLLALATGRLFVGGAPAWRELAGPAGVTLRAGLVRADGSIVIVGDDGTVLAGISPDALVEIAVPTDADLTALTEIDGELVIVGDDGVALSGTDVLELRLATIPDYRSKAYGVAVSGGAVRVVGSAAFILGPFLHFPIVTAPVHEASLEDLAFAWTWDGGPANQYTRLQLTPDGSMTVWTLIVDGDQQLALLPDLTAAAGLAPMISGRYRLDVLRVLNRDFDIDAYTTRDFNLYARDSWATNEAFFFVP